MPQPQLVSDVASERVVYHSKPYLLCSRKTVKVQLSGNFPGVVAFLPLRLRRLLEELGRGVAHLTSGMLGTCRIYGVGSGRAHCWMLHLTPAPHCKLLCYIPQAHALHSRFLRLVLNAACL